MYLKIYQQPHADMPNEKLVFQGQVGAFSVQHVLYFALGWIESRVGGAFRIYIIEFDEDFNEHVKFNEVRLHSGTCEL